MPSGQIFCTTVFYSPLPSIWYATWLCLYKMDFGPFGATPLPCPQGLHQKSKCVPPVLIHRAIAYESFRDSSLNGLGAMVWHYRWTSGRTDRWGRGERGRWGSQYPRFFFAKQGDNHTDPEIKMAAIWKICFEPKSQLTPNLLGNIGPLVL